MSLGEYVAGLVLFAATTGLAAWAGWRLVPRDLRGAERASAFCITATAAIVAVHLVPLALGVLSRWTALAAALLLAAAVARVAPRRPGAPESGRRSLGLGPIATAGVAAVAVFGLARLLQLADTPPLGVDALTFHLPGIARWIQTGSLWQLDAWVPLQSFGTYPQNGDVVQLAAILPWDSVLLARFAAAPWFALTGVATYALGRELGAARGPSALVAAALLAMPAVLRPALEQTQPDAIMLACFAAGGLFLLRHARTGERTDLLLAGAGLGLAAGTKWYGISSAVVVLVVWAVARRPSLREAGIAGGLTLAGAAPWLVHNLVETGNPLFPVRVPLLFDAPRDVLRETAGFTIADYATQPDIWREYLVPGWRTALGWVAPLLALGALVAAIRAARVADIRVVAVAAAALLLALAYAVTPYSALGGQDHPILVAVNARYLVPAVVAAAPLAALAVTRLGAPARTAAMALLLLALLDALRRSLPSPDGAAVVASVAILAVALFASRRWRAGAPRPGEPPGGSGAGRRATARRAIALAAGCAIVAIAAASLRDDTSYARFDPVLAALEGADGQRIALAGSWDTTGPAPVLPAFGADLDRGVTSAGPTVEHLLRPETDAQAFTKRIAGEDLLVAAPGTAREADWARAAGWREVARSPRLVLLEAP